MNLHELHAKRRQLLNDIRGAEQARQWELAAHLLGQFQLINNQVRDLEEMDYHPQDVRHDLAMQICP